MKSCKDETKKVWIIPMPAYCAKVIGRFLGDTGLLEPGFVVRSKITKPGAVSFILD